MSEAVDGSRLFVFLGVLTALVIGFMGVAQTLDLDLLTFGPVYMFTPMIAGIATCWYADIPLREVGLRWGHRRWIVIAAIIWPPVTLLVAVISLLIPGVQFDASIIVAETGVPAEPLWLIVGGIGLVFFMILVGMTINAVFAFGEEFGWRGYLMWECAPLGFWKASILIGMLWGIWHAPLVVVGLNYPSYPYLGIALFTVVCIAMSPIYTYLVVKGGSVLPTTVLHGVVNAVGLTALAGTTDPLLRELVASEGGLVGLIVFAMIWGVIAYRRTPRLDRSFASPRTRSDTVREHSLTTDQPAD